MKHHLALACAALWCAMPALAQQCKLATVVKNDTCSSIAHAKGITVSELQSFNSKVNCNKLVIGQQLCVSKGTAPGPPKRNSDGSCATYTTVHDDSCSAIAAKFFITTKDIEAWNAHTFQWKGCARLGAKYKLCISTGTPPPPPIIPGLQCGPQSAGNASCPLKACCGAFGFCGLTEEFCTTSGPNPCIRDCGLTKLPSCSSSSTLSRKIGYYAGWGDYRSCGVNVAPDQINWENFTGAHYAFATISQDLKIQLADTDVPLLKKLVAQRSRWPKLQVVIAVGGWAFSEDAPTKDLFSVMISNKANRATFISSVAAFLKEYELQGIDIDFEYPGAIERGAPATDTGNLASFFEELRAGLPGKSLISCATPAGYYLRLPNRPA